MESPDSIEAHVAKSNYFRSWGGGAAVVIASDPVIGALCFAGFARSYYLRAWLSTRVLAPILQLHGILMTAWILLFKIQIVFIAKHRVQLQRKLGVLGAWLAALVVGVGASIIVRDVERHAPCHDRRVFGYSRRSIEAATFRPSQALQANRNTVSFAAGAWPYRDPAMELMLRRSRLERIAREPQLHARLELQFQIRAIPFRVAIESKFVRGHEFWKSAAYPNTPHFC